MTALQNPQACADLPRWLPADWRRYLAHTAQGQSIRALARAESCHPSTVLRQVRKLENRRDDPLVDGAVRALAMKAAARTDALQKGKRSMTRQAAAARTENGGATPLTEMTEAEIDRAICDILRAMSERGAVMAVALHLEDAVVVKEDGAGASAVTATVPRQLAETLSLRDWISCPKPGGRLMRYFITAAGRAEMRRLTAAQENRAQGFAAKPHELRIASSECESATPDSPLVGLARRRDRDGQPFISRPLVAAGERLQDDFELSAVTARDPETWRDALDHGAETLPANTRRARARVRAALDALGPGLGDVALRCCCYLDGLETTEKEMGWSARSGKIVLRIALQRLVHFYAEAGEENDLIG